MKSFWLILLTLTCLSAEAQRTKPPVLKDTITADTLQEVMISARRGLSEQDFIDQLLADTLFYEAFRNLQKFSFMADDNIITFNKRYKREAHIFRKIYHNNSGAKYKQTIISQSDSGEVYSNNGQFDLFTVKMFGYIFMNDRNTDFINESIHKGENNTEGYKQKLKTLIFSPGRPVSGVPLIGDKMRLFDPKFRKYYDYSYKSAMQDTLPVYLFTVKLKPNLRTGDQNDVVIKELGTYLDKKTFAITGRYISMDYNSLPFSFKVRMTIKLSTIAGLQVPTYVAYNGEWDIPFHQKEICSFDIRHYNFNRKK